MVQHVVTDLAGRIARAACTGRLRLSTEMLRTLMLGAVALTASKGQPCYSRFCSAGEPCGSEDGCP